MRRAVTRHSQMGLLCSSSKFTHAERLAAMGSCTANSIATYNAAAKLRSVLVEVNELDSITI